MTANNNLTTNFNVDPYYDDYDETKNFHRILYRPGFAVQARELTQQQSILQNQIHRFGNHVFKDGSEVSGSSQFLDDMVVLRLKATYGGTAIDVSSFDNKYARTRGSEHVFRVKKVVAAAGGDFDHIYVQFLQSANTTANAVNLYTEVANSEVIDFSSSFINSNTGLFFSNTGAAQIVGTSDVGVSSAKLPVTRGYLFDVDESVYYHKGLFIRTPKQTVAVAANSIHNISVGFTSTETLVTSDDDSTLTDPARGSYNYAAPGADRLKVELTLTTKSISDIAAPPLSSNNYFEIARVQNGSFVRKRPAPDYNILADEIAKRTYEESGNYSVNGLEMTIANTSSSTANLIAQFTPGVAYVKGYRLLSKGVRSIEFPKSRATDSVTEQTITALYGNYLVANTITTALMGVNDRVELHSKSTPDANSKIGEAHVRNIEYLSGSGDQRKYKLFLYDIKITASDKVFNNVKSIIKGTYSSVAASIQVHSDSVTTFNKTGDITSGSASVVLTTGVTGVQVGQVIENDAFPANTHVSAISFDTITLTNQAAVSNTGSTITFRSVKLTDQDFNKSYFTLPHVNIANTVNVDYKFKRKFGTVSFTSGSATIQTLGGSERFASGAGDLVNENFIVVATSSGGGIVSGTNLDMTSPRSVSTPTPTVGNPASAVIDVNDASFNGTADIYAVIDVTADTRRVKTRNSGATKTFAGGYPANGTKLSLGYADVIKINAIYEGNSSFVSSNTGQVIPANNTVTTTISNVIDKFNFNTGQRDNFYDHGTLELKPGYTANNNQLLVDFDYYSHGGGLGYFSDKSYPSYITIPTYTDSKGRKIYLRDTLDFRPTRSSNTSSNTYISTKTFENHQIVDSQTFEVEADYSYYKRAVHKLSLNRQNNLVLTSGAAALNNPPVPDESPDAMLLATIFVNPYTYDENDLQIQLEDNRRYTMRDIGSLETRIENLEYYSTLNLLETQLQSTQFLDDNGDARYKNGFIVDTFQGHNVGDVFNSDYKVSIDRANQILKPRFTSDSTHLVAASGGTLSTNGRRVTVPFTESAYVSQTDASDTLNINPFQVVTFVGSMKLDPERDIWSDNISIPNVTTNFQGQLDHFKYLKSMEGREYGDWRTDTVHEGEIRISGPKPEYNPENQEFYAGGQTEWQRHTVQTYTITTKKLKKVNTSFHKYMRSRKVFFTAEGLRPNTRLFLSFAGHDITSYAAPLTYSSTRPEQVLFDATLDQKAIISDANGSVSGYFWVPNGNQELTYSAYTADPNAQPNANLTNVNGILQIPTGTVDVLLLDKFVAPEFASTLASTTFTAAGEIKEFELVTNRTPGTRPTVVERGYFLDTGKTREEVVRALGYPNLSQTTNGGYTIDYISTYIGNVYRNNPAINRAPEVFGFMYWINTWNRQDNPFNSDLGLLTRTMEQAGRENGATGCAVGNDPLAQTFYVPAEFYPNGIFVSSVDIFMATKDSNNLPLKVELRPTVNGFPSSEEAIPKSRVTLNPSQINANPVTPTATNVAFDCPIHLPPGEYSIVLMTDSFEYFSYIATIGDERLDGTGKITTQNTLGSLFKSQNARTWTPQQESDLTFKIYQCKFTTGTNYEITLQANNIGRVAYSANTLTSNTVGQYDVASIVMPKSDSLDVYDVSYQLRTKNLGGVVQNYVPVLPNQDLVFDTSKEITTNSDLQLKVTYKTNDTNVSPYFDLGETGITLVKNVINAPPTGNYVAETSATDGYALSKYITRKVNLGDGLSAKSLKVFVDQNMPKGATVEVYYRVINNNDTSDFNDRPYVLMTRRQPSVEVNQDILTFNEYEYYADNITYTQDNAVYDDFDVFSIKIVMYATSSAAAPSFRNFRAIALA